MKPMTEVHYMLEAEETSQMVTNLQLSLDQAHWDFRTQKNLRIT